VPIPTLSAVPNGPIKMLDSIPSASPIRPMLNPEDVNFIPAFSVFNAIFKSNFAYSSTEKPTEQNIITPGGFALPATGAAVDLDKITASLSALNTTAIFGADEVNLSANALVVFSNPTVPTDPAFQVVALSKEVSNFNFTQNYSLQMDFNIVQVNIASKYQDSTLLLAVATKDAAGKVVQYSSTYSKTTA